MFINFQIYISARNSPEEICISDDEIDCRNNENATAEETKNLKSEVQKGNDDDDDDDVVVCLLSEDDDEPDLQIVEEPEDGFPNIAPVGSVMESQTEEIDRSGLDLPRSETVVSSVPLVHAEAEIIESEPSMPSSESLVKTSGPLCTRRPVTERQPSNRRVSQDIDRLEPSCVSYQKPKETEYVLKQYGSLAFLNIRLDVCVLLSKLGSIIEVVFFNTGLNCGSKPAPWDDLPLGVSVKAVDHNSSSGVEYQRSYHFNNLPGSPKIMVNASQRDIRLVSENLVRKKDSIYSKSRLL